MQAWALCSAQTTVFPRKVVVYSLEVQYAGIEVVFITPNPNFDFAEYSPEVSATSRKHLTFLCVTVIASQTQKPVTLLRITLSLTINLQIDLLLVGKFRISA